MSNTTNARFISGPELNLLTESSDTNVKVNTPTVAPEVAHLYPVLIGSNWESFITKDSIILGRSPGPDAPETRRESHRRQQQQVDIDFGSHKRDVSRKHAEVRFNGTRMRWELRVFGKNGVKVNHTWQKPRSAAVPLTTGSLIEILGNRFLFFLPRGANAAAAAPKTTETAQQTNDERPTATLRSIDEDGRLESMIVDTLKESQDHCLGTDAIVDSIMARSDRRYDKDSVVHTLVLSEKFKFVETHNHWVLQDHSLTDPSEEFHDPLEYGDDYEEEDQGKQQQQRSSVFDGPVPSLGISIEAIYETWLTAQEFCSSISSLTDDLAETPKSSSTTLSTSGKRSIDTLSQSSVKRQRSDASVQIGRNSNENVPPLQNDPWKEVRWSDLWSRTSLS